MHQKLHHSLRGNRSERAQRQAAEVRPSQKFKRSLVVDQSELHAPQSSEIE